MKSKMKLIIGMIMGFSFSVVMLCMGGSSIYAAELEVDKEEFNEKWQETYKELQEIDPTAAEEFRALTVEEFEVGNVGYVPEERGGTEEIGPGPAPGPRPGPHVGPRPDPVEALKAKGISDEDIGKIRKAEEALSVESEKVEWDKLTPEEARKVEQSFGERFKEMSGYDPKDIFAPPPGDHHPEGPYHGPGHEGPYAGPHHEGPYVGPRPEPGFIEGPYPGPGHEGPYAGPHPERGFEGPVMGGPMPEGPVMGGPMPEGPMMEGPAFEGPMMGGPMPEGPMMDRPMFEGPMMEGPAFEGPMMEGPAFEGPMMEGPAFEGPAFEGPAFEGPAFEGPAFEGPAFEGPAFEGPAFEGPAFEGPGEDIEHIHDENMPPPPEENNP